MLSKHFCFLVLILFSASVFSANPLIYSHKTRGAIKGADVVAYHYLKPGDPAVMGSDDFTYQWRGATWKFANKEHRSAFIKDPEAYAPQYGGYCAFAVSHNFTTSIRPNSWTIIDGKLYLNHNRVSYKKFSKDPLSMIAKADANWPAVLKKCEKRNNCRK